MPRAQRERLILDVAGQLFARDGYHSASMDDIAAAADVSKPMVYAYFGSKEALYIAYIDRTGRELVERLSRTFEEDDASPVRLRVQEFLGFVEQHRDGWRILFSEANSVRPVADEVAVLRAQIVEAVRRLVELGAVGLPGLVPGAADAAAQAIVGAGESIANWWLEHPEIEREQVVEWYSGLVGAAVTAICAPLR